MSKQNKIQKVKITLVQEITGNLRLIGNSYFISWKPPKPMSKFARVCVYGENKNKSKSKGGLKIN